MIYGIEGRSIGIRAPLAHWDWTLSGDSLPSCTSAVLCVHLHSACVMRESSYVVFVHLYDHENRDIPDHLHMHVYKIFATPVYEFICSSLKWKRVIPIVFPEFLLAPGSVF